MLLTKTVLLKAPPKLFKYYKEKGYDVKYDQYFECNIEDLSVGSHSKVEVECDYCGEVVLKTYKAYIREHNNQNKDTCSKCRYNKTKETLIERYGVDKVMDVEGVKDKIKNTCLEKYGVDSVSKVPEIRDKAKNTCLDKYGDEYYMRTEEGKEKSKRNMLEKYGMWYTGTQEYKDKLRETSIKKYGCENPAQSELVKKKRRETCLERYGFESSSCSPIVLEKIKQTHNERFGCYYSKTDEFKKATKATWQGKSAEEIDEITRTRENTMIEKYGVPYCMQLDEYVMNWMNKVKDVKYSCKYHIHGQPCSEQQKDIYNLVSTKYNDTEINYPELRYSIDVALFEGCNKIAIEYDGWYWHRNKQDKDNEKNNKLIKNGWKVFRIKSAGIMPSDDEIFDSIDILLNTDKQYIEIITKDWIKREEACVQ